MKEKLEFILALFLTVFFPIIAPPIVNMILSR